MSSLTCQLQQSSRLLRKAIQAQRRKSVSDSACHSLQNRPLGASTRPTWLLRQLEEKPCRPSRGTQWTILQRVTGRIRDRLSSLRLDCFSQEPRRLLQLTRQRRHTCLRQEGSGHHAQPRSCGHCWSLTSL